MTAFPGRYSARAAAALLLPGLFAAAACTGPSSPRAAAQSAPGPSVRISPSALPQSSQLSELGPVLIVTGYGGSLTGPALAARAFRASGRSVVLVPPVGDGRGDLREVAQSLRLVANRELEAGAPSVDVLGFSAGGITARIWASELGGAKVARRIITVGSPHAGVRLRSGGTTTEPPADCPIGCKQLWPNSELLRALPPPSLGPQWISLWSTTDQVVSSPSSGQLPGSLGISLQNICPQLTTSHSALLRDPEPLGMIVQLANARGPAHTPGASQCASISAYGKSLGSQPATPTAAVTPTP